MLKRLFLGFLIIGVWASPDLSAQAVDSLVLNSTYEPVGQAQLNSAPTGRPNSLKSFGTVVTVGGIAGGLLMLGVDSYVLGIGALNGNTSSFLYKLMLNRALLGSVICAGVSSFGVALYLAGRYGSISNTSAYGFSVMADVANGVVFLQGSLLAGYHFNPYVYVGGGVAPIVPIADIGYYLPTNVKLPICGQARFCLSDAAVTPFAAVTPGYDVFNGYYYGAVDVGVRIHMSNESGHSAWSGVRGMYYGKGDDFWRSSYLSLVIGMSF